MFRFVTIEFKIDWGIYDYHRDQILVGLNSCLNEDCWTAKTGTQYKMGCSDLWFQVFPHILFLKHFIQAQNKKMSYIITDYFSWLSEAIQKLKIRDFLENDAISELKKSNNLFLSEGKKVYQHQ